MTQNQIDNNNDKKDDNKNTITASISQLNGEKIEKFTFRDKNSIEKAIEEIKEEVAK